MVSRYSAYKIRGPGGFKRTSKRRLPLHPVFVILTLAVLFLSMLRLG